MVPRDLTDPKTARHFAQRVRRASERTLLCAGYVPQPSLLLSDEEQQPFAYTTEQVRVANRAHKNALREQGHNYRERRDERS